jgi:putative intracellular protease/amidase
VRGTSHQHLNPLDLNKPKRVAIVIANPGASSTTGWPVGFWWAELTYPYLYFTEAGYQVEISSPGGGAGTPDAMSYPEDASHGQSEDVISRGYKNDREFVKLVQNTNSVDSLDVDCFGALLVARGHGPMFPFEAAINPRARFVELYESGKLTAALCHGVAILRHARLANGEPLVNGKTVTGFRERRGGCRRSGLLADGGSTRGHPRDALAASRTSSRRSAPATSRPVCGPVSRSGTAIWSPGSRTSAAPRRPT